MYKLLAPIAAAAMLAVAAPASAVGVFNEFTVTEGVVPGTVANTFVADKINGSYEEYLTVTGPGTFAAAAFAQFTSFLKDDGATGVPSQLNGFGAAGYKLVAVFQATGAITGPNSFSSTTNVFSLYLDVDANTTASFTDGTAAPTLAGTADDHLLATAGPLLSTGTGNLNGPPGAFNIDWGSFALTSGTAGIDGDEYFTAPVPFYMNIRVNGDYDALTNIPPSTTRITGDVSAVFAVPEPTTLALAGLALFGMGLARRRTKA